MPFSIYTTQETKTKINVNETTPRELLATFLRTAIAKTETKKLNWVRTTPRTTTKTPITKTRISKTSTKRLAEWR
jgi:hypothetical protein